MHLFSDVAHHNSALMSIAMCCNAGAFSEHHATNSDCAIKNERTCWGICSLDSNVMCTPLVHWKFNGNALNMRCNTQVWSGPYDLLTFFYVRPHWAFKLLCMRLLLFFVRAEGAGTPSAASNPYTAIRGWNMLWLVGAPMVLTFRSLCTYNADFLHFGNLSLGAYCPKC